MSSAVADPISSAVRVWRIEVHPADPNDDPVGRSVLHDAREFVLAPGLREVRFARVFLIEADLDESAVNRIAAELLADPINQRYVIGAEDVPSDAALVEVHYLPGVMDPVAESTRDAILEMLSREQGNLEVRTGFRYDLFGATPQQAHAIAHHLLANTVIQKVESQPYQPAQFVHAKPYEFKLIRVPIRDLDDAALQKLSRTGHLFLSLEEMKTIQNYFRELDREPTDVELETLAQTWSEHCVHKTLKSRINLKFGNRQSAIDIDWRNRPGHTVNPDNCVTIDNLLKSTVAAATHKLQADGLDWCISVFEDNAGVIVFDDDYGVSFKVETHNHPSAIEPYGGAATGVGGCIRDTMGTGLAAKPVANTDVFCVADPNYPADKLPRGVLHPRRILNRVVAGVRDYGNRMGIPTVNGAVWFDDRYLGNPLVFCGSVGLIPRDKCFGDPRKGDRIIVLGGRTGRDGIHGATFSSAELTDSHADEFSHAVQIGNAITEKKMLDVILQARDHHASGGGCLFSAITDCGAGGFSSAVGEMGEDLGAYVELSNAPLKYAGLSYTEIWISEAQERMVLAVPPKHVPTLTALCECEDVEYCDLGHFGTDTGELILHYQHTEVGRLSMDFLHNGIPQPTRKAVWSAPPARPASAGLDSTTDFSDALLKLLAHPNIASKHWIIRQYDHEVQGGSAVKPLVGPEAVGPSDAAVIRPRLDSERAIALSCGLSTDLGDVDPYWMTLAAIDEAVRNAVCTGSRSDRIAILDNFCWPSCDDPHNLGSLVRAAEACYDGALAYRTPFISGKDSLNNQFTTEDGRTIAIPPTLLISAVGIVDDVSRCVTMDAKEIGNILLQVGPTTAAIGRSHYQKITAQLTDDIPHVDLKLGPQVAAAVADLIQRGLIRSAHDCSEGGLLVAAAEMAFAGNLGLEFDLAGAPHDGRADDTALCFAESPSRYLLEVAPKDFDIVAKLLRQANIPFGEVGRVNDSTAFTVRSSSHGRLLEIGIEQLKTAWRKPLDW